jgi:5-formyltetrahydrofolate cyclo-ligase
MRQVLRCAPTRRTSPSCRLRAGYGRAVDAKQRIRERIWWTLEDEGAARFPGARGRIPNFRGAEAAAERLAELPEWEAATVVKSNPDAPQLPARRRACRDGKTLYMAVPRLAEAKPFVRVGGDPTIKKALTEGQPAGVEDLGHLDLVVCGTVAVNRAGVRVGKGGGYSDLELGLLIEADRSTTRRRSRRRSTRFSSSTRNSPRPLTTSASTSSSLPTR